MNAELPRQVAANARSLLGLKKDKGEGGVQIPEA